MSVLIINEPTLFVLAFFSQLFFFFLRFELVRSTIIQLQEKFDKIEKLFYLCLECAGLKCAGFDCAAFKKIGPQ